LLPLVYAELRRLAAHKLSREPRGQTLQATALVHEAWLRLAGPEDQRWEGPPPFLRGGGGGHAKNSRGPGAPEAKPAARRAPATD